MKAVIDITSETWKAILESREARLIDLRSRNDGALDEIKTAHLRGRIAEIKELLALAAPDPAHMADEA